MQLAPCHEVINFLFTQTEGDLQNTPLRRAGRVSRLQGHPRWPAHSLSVNRLNYGKPWRETIRTRAHGIFGGLDLQLHHRELLQQDCQ